LIGWGGNNGSTFTAGIIANKLNMTWKTKRGKQSVNYYGSIMTAYTIRLEYSQDNQEVYVPLKDVLSVLNPNDLAISG
jgi:myo-inositol-1-phosphate synthase